MDIFIRNDLNQKEKSVHVNMAIWMILMRFGMWLVYEPKMKLLTFDHDRDPGLDLDLSNLNATQGGNGMRDSN